LFDFHRRNLNFPSSAAHIALSASSGETRYRSYFYVLKRGFLPFADNQHVYVIAG
jgi:hypothetical protein